MTCTLDSQNAQPCSSPFGYTQLADGQHEIVVTATDEAGNTTSASRIFNVLATPPNVSIDSPADGAVAAPSGTVTFSGSGTNGAPDPVTFTCSLDDAATTVCTSPYAYSNLDNGPHTFQVTAYDLLGKTASATRDFSVLATSPNVSVTSPAEGALTAGTGSVTFSGSSTDNAPGLVTFSCSLDSASPTACTSPFAYSGLGNGQHTFQLIATDGYGQSTSGDRAFTVDGTPPNVSVDSPSDEAVTGPTGSVTFSGSSSANPPGPVTFTCSLDAATPTACTSPLAYSGLGNGPHTIQVTATDLVGNTASATRDFNVLATPPNVSVTSPAEGALTAGTGSVTFTGSSTANPPGPVTFTCSLDAATPTACTSPLAYSGLGNGPHTIQVTATDLVGNTASATRDFNVLATPPNVSVTSPAEGALTAGTGSVTFTGSSTANPPGPVTFTCSLDAATPTACTSPLAYSGLGNGPHTIQVTATDLVGNTASTTRDFNVDATPPVIAFDAPAPNATILDTAGILFHVTDPDNAAASLTTTCRLDNGPSTPCLSPYEHKPFGVGTHTLTVISKDPLGNQSVLAVLHFSVLKPDLTITSTGKPSSLKPGQSIRITVTVVNKSKARRLAQVVSDLTLNRAGGGTTTVHVINETVWIAAGRSISTVAPVSIPRSAAPGSYTLQTNASDPTGLVISATPIKIT